MNAIPPAPLRHDWTTAEIQALLDLPFPDLIFRAASTHRAHHDPNRVQISTLLSIKTGGCPEDCAYCPQSAAYEAGVPASKLMDVAAVLAEGARRKTGRCQPLLHGAPPGAARRIAISTQCAPWSRASPHSASKPA